MGRTVAVIWHASFSIVAAGLYFFFVLPRWPELMGDTPQTLGLVLRIVTGVLIGLAALPVVFTLQRTKRPELSTPELALRLRTASISLHVLAAVLIVGTAIAEIWLSLDSFGPWLFGIYGAAAAIALLGIFAFYLAFLAELPPPPPKPVKPVKSREKSQRRGRKKAAEAEETTEAAAEEVEEAEAAEAEAAADAEEAEDAEETAAEEDEKPAVKTLGNRRPSSKSGTKRRGWRSRGEVATED
ncbi:hypothetical protein A5731_22075 [Mycolicibacterium conceptionense]|jgi:hypothetical protein|uniref:Membrane protein n=3 Tax=Mycolicibacterium TaxID=1866885 RepID=A0A0J8U2D3_9MYCO|nr:MULTISPECIES: hypothetical protein [Mycolicibacterium]KLI05275.1 membrane protein [Mycolicibacterium senegalense]KLO53121.1 membrane protein [Mycolicibacterium senegalense]KMV15718.1 membrane protein [Mycolicibacterium conceptionense]MCW1821296.1 hypothetical protein [Mycolicibacterium senegalense]OBB13145.1 hypothetical protein A5718_03255 [Mycolicibacterium conceptionense]